MCGIETIVEQVMLHVRADLTLDFRKKVEDSVELVVKSGAFSMVEGVARDLQVKGQRIIEVGCGTCWHGPLLLALKASSYIGIDFYVNPKENKITMRTDAFSEDRPYQEAPLTLSEFLESFNNCGFIKEDFLSATLPFAAFDAAFMVSVTEHLADHRNTFRKIRDLLVPGGKLYFAHDNYYSWKGHHLRPRTVNDYNPNDPAMRRVADWGHIVRFVTHEQTGLDLPLNFIRIHELIGIVNQIFHIDHLHFTKSSEDILSRLTDEIRGFLPEYYREELETEMVYCLCSKPADEETVPRLIPRPPEGHSVSLDIGWAIHEKGFCYITRIPAIANLGSHILFEDGFPLGPAESMHDDIRSVGVGRYSLWGEYLYFSASDNSDPRSNKKHYSLKPPHGQS